MERASRQRAVHWYEQAAPELTGLAKTLAEKRIAESRSPGNVSDADATKAAADAASANPFIGLSNKRTMKGGLQFRINPDGTAQYIERGVPGLKGRWVVKHNKLMISWDGRKGGILDIYDLPVNDVMKGWDTQLMIASRLP